MSSTSAQTKLISAYLILFISFSLYANAELNANPAIPDGKDWQKEFDTRDAAVVFAADENYVICQLPCSLDPKRNANKTEEVNEEEVE